MAALLLVYSGTGCSKIVGFKDVSLEKDGGPVDAPVDMIIDTPVDMMIDTPPPKIFAFETTAAFAGNFGGRANADINCQNKYNATFSALGCTLTNVHAFVQVDDVNDTLARLEINYPIPQGVPVLRASDGVTPVANNWDDFVNPNTQLLSPISTSGASIFFWSGRAAGGNLNCTNWTSNSSAISGNAGDATRVVNWTASTNFTCNNFSPRLLCFCW